MASGDILLPFVGDSESLTASQVFTWNPDHIDTTATGSSAPKIEFRRYNGIIWLTWQARIKSGLGSVADCIIGGLDASIKPKAVTRSIAYTAPYAINTNSQGMSMPFVRYFGVTPNAQPRYEALTAGGALYMNNPRYFNADNTYAPYFFGTVVYLIK